MNKRMIRLLQRVLAAAGRYDGDIDGLRGPRTEAGVEAIIGSRAGDLARSPAGWSLKRKSIACIQLGCADRNIEVGSIDGLLGPQTEHAAEVLETLLETGARPFLWRDLTPLDVNPNDWPNETEAAMTSVYGPPGNVPLVRVDCPWQLSIAWDTRQKTRTIRIHELCADSLVTVLSRVHDHYGEDEIRRLGLHLYGGSFNKRRKRGGSAWSTHAWGIAIDWDPAHNKLRDGGDKARMARPDYDDWWRFWEEEGWVGLGRMRNFDWMHVQAAKV